MPNPVQDSLTSWQADADGADTNQPTNSTGIGDGQAGDLDGELRRIKSEIRAESINKSWERWLGIKNLAGTEFIAFTYVSPTTFTVNDDFVGINRGVVYWGRRVRAFGSGGFLGAGTVTGYVYVAPNTTIAIQWDSGSGIDATLSEVQFGLHPGTFMNPSANPLLPHVTANVTVAGQVALTNLFTGTLPASMLLTNRVVRYNFLGIFSINANSTIQLTFTYGTTQIAGLFITGDPSLTWFNRPFWIEVLVCGDGSATAQVAFLRASMQGTNIVPGPRFGSPAADRVEISRGTGTENSTIDQPVSLGVQMSASPNDSVTIERVFTELI